MSKQVAILGDATNYGGRIITASGYGYSDGDGIALLGDLVSCPRCSSTGRIIEGTNDFIIDGKLVAYDGCIVACKCTPVGEHRILAFKSTMYVGVSSGSVQSNSFAGNQKQFNSANNDENNLIRIDARRLLQCADELCEKHLYHDDIKQAFKQDVEAFANDIVERVDSGAMTYEQGAEKIKEEEKSLLDQSLIWISNGLSIFGGAGLTSTGIVLCYTGWGCVVGAPMVAHGLNGIYEGSAGIFNGVMNEIDGGNRDMEEDGPLRKLYQSGAEAIGYDASIGDIIYDVVDLKGSLYGKVKLIPKLNEFGDPLFKLFSYARKDLEMAYKQMSKLMLEVELISDALSVIKIFKNSLNAYIFNKDTEQVVMVVRKPKTIINVKQIVDDCDLIITTANTDEKTPVYYLCNRKDGTEYKKDTNGNIIEDSKE
ncbi:Uropathogenic specific protein [Gilliamella apicola]|uniref:PAAR domain-containing protein n=1 Tax=Gilliamella apicola TaxID=1196095 RepID=UPI00042EA0BE|nr:PAAR domain-containing protein [Gilliamella apicola]AHN25140.1 Uropathogenic specific protein [Gilliamella apicola]PXV88237.1 putative Zn-binding protein involved in type VI secretion [Gilliamella apicola]